MNKQMNKLKDELFVNQNNMKGSNVLACVPPTLQNMPVLAVYCLICRRFTNCPQKCSFKKWTKNIFNISHTQAVTLIHCFNRVFSSEYDAKQNG